MIAVGVEGRIDRRVDEQLRGGLGDAAVATEDGGDRGQIAAGAVTGDRGARGVDAQLLGAFDRPAERRECVERRGRGAMFGGQAVADRDDDGWLPRAIARQKPS